MVRSTVETTTYIEYPGAFRVDAKTPAGTVVRIFKGGEFWMSDATVRREVSPAEADQMRGTVQRDVIGLLLALVDGKVAATRLPDVVNRDRRLTALGVGGAIKAVVLLLDPATNLIVAQRYDADRGASRVEEQFSDYRNVNGLQVAFSAVVQIDGLPAATRRVRTFDTTSLWRLTSSPGPARAQPRLSPRASRFVIVFSEPCE